MSPVLTHKISTSPVEILRISTFILLFLPLLMLNIGRGECQELTTLDDPLDLSSSLHRTSGGVSFPRPNGDDHDHGEPLNDQGVVHFQKEEIVAVEGGRLPCKSPGRFVPAPDGCNRCFCEQDGQLSATCTRGHCPPGYPSSYGGGRLFPKFMLQS